MRLPARTKTRLRRLAAKYETASLRQARNLGLVRTNAATMHTALEITVRLAEAFPGDPCKGDFALYGLGISDIPSARSLRSRAGGL